MAEKSFFKYSHPCSTTVLASICNRLGDVSVLCFQLHLIKRRHENGKINAYRKSTIRIGGFSGVYRGEVLTRTMSEIKVQIAYLEQCISFSFYIICGFTEDGGGGRRGCGTTAINVKGQKCGKRVGREVQINTCRGRYETAKTYRSSVDGSLLIF